MTQAVLEQRDQPARAAVRPHSEPAVRPIVCQVLHSLNIGGAEMLAYRLALGLGERFRFVFACLDDIGPLGEVLQDRGLQVAHLHRRNGFDVRCVRRLAEFVHANGAHVIHAHQYTPFFYSLAPGTLRRRPPVLFTEHGRWFPDYPRRKRIIFNRLCLRRRDRVVGVGESVRQALVQNERIPRQRVGVIYNGVDLQSVARHVGKREQMRRKLGLHDDEFTIIHVARFDGLKDHGTALRAMGRVVAQQPRAKLLLVGDGDERPAIKAEMARLGLGDSVRLLGLRGDVARLLHAADVFLLSSISEGIPLTAIEAMAARLPVVSTKVGGLAEIVLDNHTGLLTPPRDDRALAAAMLRLAGDCGLRRQMGQAGYDRAQSIFAEKRMHDAYASLYEEMMCLGIHR